MLGLGNKLTLQRKVGSGIAGLIASQHIERVLADGGFIQNPTLLKERIATLVSNYSLTDEVSFYNKVRIGLEEAVFGYKVGTGSGITLGQACSKLYSINPISDVEQATPENQPLLLVKNTDQYYFAPRVTGNNIRTVNSQVTAYNTATDTVVMTAKVFLNQQTTASFDYIFTCGSAGNFQISNRNASKMLRFRGTANALDSSLYTPSTTEPHWVRFTITTTQVIYEWSANGTSWTNIGTQSRPTVGAYSTTLQIGSTASTPNNATSVYYVLFQNVTTGKSVSFTPNLYNRLYLENGFEELDGTIWGMQQSTGTAELKGLIVDETMIIGNGSSYKLSNGSLVTTQPYTLYATYARQGTGVIYGLGASSQLSNDATNTILNNGSALSIANASKGRQLVTCGVNGASSEININNGTPVTGNSGANNGTYLDILANGATYGNYVFNSLYLIDN